jgi:outer membrane protein TolC
MQNAQLNMKTTSGSYGLAKSLYEMQKQQYRLGTLPYSGLMDSERSVTTAEQNYVQAVYTYLLAKISYDKAKGKF